ncbi:MAG: hypothetical protein CME65_04785 [Halobacteriovoraceae bacterium]|nr:hypothetical protein [Halobacteriovoraceae bacterium]|tara:strand:+ start:19616 stop:19963 length:348 start_codon:yes stop_codon:yes gene_type:complete
MAKTSSNLKSFYFKQIFQVFIGLFVFIVLPFIALRVWMPDIPHMLYYFLGILFVLKIMIFQDNVYMKSIEKKAPKLIGSNSKNEIFRMGKFLVNSRNALLVIAGLSLFIINIVSV